MTQETTQQRILIVDDDRIVASLMKAGIDEMEQDFLVDKTSQSQEAVTLIEQHDYALVMTDYQMPGMNGVELANKVREISPQTHIIMLTALSAREKKDLIPEGTVDGILEKPTSIVCLWATIEELLGT